MTDTQYQKELDKALYKAVMAPYRTLYWMTAALVIILSALIYAW